MSLTYLSFSIQSPSWSELLMLLRTNCHQNTSLEMIMFREPSLDTCLSISDSIMNIGSPSMKLIPMMTGESPSKSSKKLCQFLNDGVSKAMLRNFSNKLMQMAKAWFCSTSLPPGLSRKISILILMMIFSETLKTLKIFEVSNKIYVSFYQIRLNSCFMFNINMKSIISIMHTLPKGSHEQRYSHKCFQCSFLTKLFLLRNFRVFSVPI